MEEDGFQLVRSRRKNKHRQAPHMHHAAVWKNRWSHNVECRPTCTSTKVSEQVTDATNIQKILANIHRLTAEMRGSDFYTLTVIPCLEAALRGLGCTEEQNALIIKSIVCYGLGNFTESIDSVQQLALLLCLKDDLMIGDINNCVQLFDPVFNKIERSLIVDDLGLHLIDKNEQCARKVNVPTCFFMPHCDLNHYCNLLAANWDKTFDRPSTDVILIGNSLPSLVSFDAISRGYIDVTEYTNVTKCLDVVDEYPLRRVNDADTYWKAFSNTSIHTFRRYSERKK